MYSKSINTFVNKFWFGVLIVLFFLFSLYLQTQLVNRPLQDNDEGIYLTTFLLVNKGYPLYKETFFSQPPGFFYLVYPGFLLFGKTLQAARLTIGLWSIASLSMMVWMCIVLKKKWAALLSLSLLYLIPSYYNQTLIFQSDGLAAALSLITVCFILLFASNRKILFFILSCLFLNLAFLTKFDFFTIFPFISVIVWMYIKYKPNRGYLYRLIIIFMIITALIAITTILVFDSAAFLNNVVLLRLQASQIPFKPFILFDYIRQSRFFMFTLVCSGLLALFNKDTRRFPLLIFFIWMCSIYIFLLFYHPLFPHHLIMLIVPTVLFFSLSVNSYLEKSPLYYPVLVAILLFISISNQVKILTIPLPKVNNDLQKVLMVISKYTNPNDFIVTDEEILYSQANRFPPPQLSDISFVRIKSGNLTAQQFKQIIFNNKPKLIIPVNGRLESMPNFLSTLSNYIKLTEVNRNIIYIKMD
jgi:4-amino-4-deoxy-L-arabinose transferase-like glycosyltransferase